MTITEATEQAEHLVGSIVSLSGGPISTREDAVRFLRDALRAAYQKGWDDKQRQLAQAMYPR